jgi:predicted porin
MIWNQESIMHKSKASLAAAVGAALLAAGTSSQGQGLEVKLSGQVNRALMSVDDGVRSDSFFVDNDNSSTRFRLVGSAPVMPGLKAGVVWEMEFQGNDSNLVTMATRDINPVLGERHTDVFFESDWGKISLGQGDGAANGAVEVDLSGTSVAHYAGVTDVGAAFAFRDGAGALTGPTIGASTDRQDFESRYDRLRYDTPVFGGFRLAGSVGTRTSRDVTEVALWYSGDLGGAGKLAGALGYSKKDALPGGVDDKIIGGSLSWLHTSGFNATIGRTERDITAAQEGTFSYVKLGYKAGRHAVSVDHGRGEDQAAVGDEGKVTGIGYVYTPVAWADLYALYKRHSLDRPGASFQDIDIAMVGSRLRF